MFRRIVVGVGGSAESEDAVALGAALATATGAGLTLLGAFAPFPIVDGAADGDLPAAAVERRLAVLRERYAPCAHITSVAAENPARALLVEAESWHANLIVIGSSRDAMLGHCAIGRTGRRLLNKLPSALAIARRGLHEDEVALLNIGVGYDGGAESERAVEFADRLAVCAGADLAIETVNKDPIPTLLSGETLSPPVLDEIREGAQLGALRLGERAAARTTAATHVDASLGEPGAVLGAVAPSLDLMVIGSRRWGLLPRVLLGGVGERLVSDCGTSLVIVSMPGEHPTALRESPHAAPRGAPTPGPASGDRLRP